MFRKREQFDEGLTLGQMDTYGKKTSHRALQMDEWTIARNLLGALWLVTGVVVWCAYPTGTKDRLWKAVGVGGIPVLMLLFVVVWLFLITGERTRTEEKIIKPRHVEAPENHIVKEVTQVELHVGKNRIVHAEIPGPYRAIVYWARAACQNQSLAYGAWQDHFQTRGRDKRVCYAEFRQWWVQAGHAMEKGKEGLVILWDGEPGKEYRNTREFIEALAACNPNDEATPLLEQPHVQKALAAPTHSHTHPHRLLEGGSEWED